MVRPPHTPVPVPVAADAPPPAKGAVRARRNSYSGSDGKKYALSGQTGSLMYMSPEVYLNEKYNEKARAVFVVRVALLRDRPPSRLSTVLLLLRLECSPSKALNPRK
jgi:hypothetical protein